MLLRPEAWNRGVGRVGSPGGLGGRLCPTLLSQSPAVADSPWHPLASSHIGQLRAVLPVCLHFLFS